MRAVKNISFNYLNILHNRGKVCPVADTMCVSFPSTACVCPIGDKMCVLFLSVTCVCPIADTVCVLLPSKTGGFKNVCFIALYNLCSRHILFPNNI